jgi:thymidylate kinase
MKGVFITIYGVNNIGKSTHARLLLEHLRSAGYDTAYLKYPIYDLEPTGPQINRILRSEGKQKITEKELQTLFAQNRRDYEPQLRGMLKEGKIVLAEDYTGTGLAWGTAKGLSPEFMEELNKGLLKEDLAILITGKRDIGAMEKTHIHEKNSRLVDTVGEILQKLAKKFGWEVVPLQPTISDTQAQIRKITKEFLG